MKLVTKNFLAFVVGFVVLFAAVAAFAGGVTLSWTAPTLNEDNTPYIDPDGYKMYYGLTLGGPYPTQLDIPDPATLSVDITDLSAGTYYFVATAYNTSGIESVFSNEAMKVVLPAAPQAPGMLTVSELVVYTLVKIENEFRLVAVGTVPANTSCDPNQNVNGYYAVPVDQVTWSATVRDIVVVAQCS